jgi:type II secretion system protein G
MTSTRLLLARHLMGRLAKRSRKGFTLIELLVVVVIIGILASVALPSFVGAQDKARNASVQSNCRTVQMALEEFSTENNGAYPATAAAWTTAPAFCGTGTTYLPGGKIPLAPWCKQNQAGGIGVAAPLLGVTASVAAATPKSLTPINTPMAAAGAIVDPPAAQTNYGSVMYDYNAPTQYYVLYANGKKGKNAIVVGAVSNAGQ